MCDPTGSKISEHAPEHFPDNNYQWDLDTLINFNIFTKFSSKPSFTNSIPFVSRYIYKTLGETIGILMINSLITIPVILVIGFVLFTRVHVPV